MCQDETLQVVACDRAQRIKCCISHFLRFGGFAAFFLYLEALKITDWRHYLQDFAWSEVIASTVLLTSYNLTTTIWGQQDGKDIILKCIYVPAGFLVYHPCNDDIWLVFCKSRNCAGTMVFQWSDAEAIDHLIFSLEASCDVDVNNLVLYHSSRHYSLQYGNN